MRAQPPRRPYIPTAALAVFAALTAACGVADPIIATANNSNTTVVPAPTQPAVVAPTDTTGGDTGGSNNPPPTTDSNMNFVASLKDGKTALSPTVMWGNTWLDERLHRSDITADPISGGAQPGVPLTVILNVFNASEQQVIPLADTMVSVWHANAQGLYANCDEHKTWGQGFLKGYQFTDGNGQVTFHTVVPGWTPGRSPHVHVRIRESSANYHWSTQLFFNDNVLSSIYGLPPYSTHGMPDANNGADAHFQRVCFDGNSRFACGQTSLLALTTDSAGGYVASANIYVDTTGL